MKTHVFFFNGYLCVVQTTSQSKWSASSSHDAAVKPARKNEERGMTNDIAGWESKNRILLD